MILDINKTNDLTELVCKSFALEAEHDRLEEAHKKQVIASHVEREKIYEAIKRIVNDIRKEEQ